MDAAGVEVVRWTVVLPVKHADLAKSRLAAPDGVPRPALARAIALDSLAAVRACALVGRRVVVTSDPEVADAGRALGDLVLDDPGTGLDAAIDAGLAHARRLAPGPVAVLLADLPALRPTDLGRALALAGRHSTAFVPDDEGTGTVLLTARRADDLHAAFGPLSAARHARLGAHRLDLDLPSLRRDVDTRAGLAAAADVGLGAATTALLDGVSGSPARAPRSARRSRSG